MVTPEKELKKYSPIIQNLYMNLNNPLGLHVNINKPSIDKLNYRISFSSFENTTCSDLLKLNYLDINNNILILSLNNYSYKVGLINKIDYKLQSLRLPQIEIIEPWKDIGYLYPPYKNYDIIEESIFYSFTNICKIDLKNKDLFIPFSCTNNISDFSNIGDIFFESFQINSIGFKEPSFVQSLIILEEIKMEKEKKLFYKKEKIYNEDIEHHPNKNEYDNENVIIDKNENNIIDKNENNIINKNENDIIKKNENNIINKNENNIINKNGNNIIDKSDNENNKKRKRNIKNNEKVEYSNNCKEKLKELNLFNLTAIIINISSIKTTCTPIINGIPLPDLMKCCYIGGYDIDNQIYDEMKRNEKHQKEISLTLAKVAKEKILFTPKNREECNYLSLLYNKNPRKYLISCFELKFNYIFESAVNSTEIFFSKFCLENYLKTESYKNLHTYDLNFNFLFSHNYTLPELIQTTILKCPIDYRKELFNNIYITGGTSLIRGFRERIENELYDLINHNNFYNKINVKVHILKRKLLQKYSIYTGTHYFLELFNYNDYNITKKEYEEYGENVLYKYSLQGKLFY